MATLTTRKLMTIVAMWPDHTVKQIAAATGMTQSCVEGIACRNRDLCPPKRRCGRIADDEASRMRSLRDEGLTYAQIAERLGCTRRRVDYCLRERGRAKGATK